MSFEEEFDKIMREKAEGAEFPVDQRNLDKLGFLLDARNAAAPIIWWKKIMVPAAAILVLTTSAYLYFNSSINETSATKLVAEKSQTIAGGSVNASSYRNAQKPVASATAAASEFQLNDQSKAVENRPLSDTHILKSNPAILSIKPASVAKNSMPDDADVKSKSTLNHSKKLATPANTVTQKTPNSDEISKQVKETELQTENTSFPIKEKDEPKALGSGTFSAGEKIVSTESADSPMIPENSSITPEVEHIAWLPSIVGRLEQSEGPELVNYETSILQRYENDDYVPTYVKNYLAVQGGLHYGLGWKVGNTADGVGLNYFGGIEFGHLITEKISVSAGLQYYQFSNMYQAYYTSRVRGYGFGYNDAYSTVTTDLLQYLAVPLKFGYQLNKSLKAGVGVNAAYLVAAHSRIDHYGVSDGVKGQITSQGVNKIYEGSNDVNVMGSVFLQARVLKRISVFAEYQYGLTDLFKDYNKSEVIQVKQRSTGIRLGLNINLFER